MVRLRRSSADLGLGLRLSLGLSYELGSRHGSRVGVGGRPVGSAQSAPVHAVPQMKTMRGRRCMWKAVTMR